MNKPSVKPSCKGCERRHPGCHSECEDYAAYKAELEKVRKAEKLDRADTSTAGRDRVFAVLLFRKMHVHKYYPHDD